MGETGVLADAAVCELTGLAADTVFFPTGSFVAFLEAFVVSFLAVGPALGLAVLAA